MSDDGGVELWISRWTRPRQLPRYRRGGASIFDLSSPQSMDIFKANALLGRPPVDLPAPHKMPQRASVRAELGSSTRFWDLSEMVVVREEVFLHS